MKATINEGATGAGFWGVLLSVTLALTGACDDAGEPCGNNKRKGKEVCDGRDLAGQTCTGLGFGEGTLGCRPDCGQFDTGECTAPTGGTGFAAADTRWSVPENDTAVALDRGFHTMWWSGGAQYWATIDLNGDGRKDFVWTGEPLLDGVFYTSQVWGKDTGNPHWRVFLADATGFVEPAVEWPVPTLTTDIGFDNGFFATDQVSGAWSWATIDLTGDGRVDLVWTGEPRSDGDDYVADVWGKDSGQPYWRVFENTGTGFSTTAQDWPVPVADSAVPLDHGFNATWWNAAAQYWKTMDLDGDGRPDFVWTGEPRLADTEYHADVWGLNEGQPHWRVYLNTGAGFAPTALDWPVPAFEASFPTRFGFYGANWSGGAQHWATLDLDGDGRSDLVWTAEPMFDGEYYSGRVWGFDEGAPYWRVYRNTGAGFAKAPLQWWVPLDDARPGLAHGFFATQRSEGEAYWSTLDLNGDGKLDLVWTGEPVTSGAERWATVWGLQMNEPHWRVFLNFGDRFAPTAINWQLPVPDSAVILERGFHVTTWSGGAQHWATSDLTGDGQPDFVWTGEPKLSGSDFDGAVWGMNTLDSHWRVFENRRD